jgi:Domain of unknown function (DUF6457)
MTAREFLEAFAAEVGAPPPSPGEIGTLLELAGVAAHASERSAAPIACWIGASSGLSASELLAVAQRLAPGIG